MSDGYDTFKDWKLNSRPAPSPQARHPDPSEKLEWRHPSAHRAPLPPVAANSMELDASWWDYVAHEVYANSIKHGFWDEPRNDGEMIALIHSECTELLEAVRHSNPPSEHIPLFSAAEEELADIVIRVMDMTKGRGWNVAKAIEAKMLFNRDRQFKHGKVF
jgi:NTP pyrophosphatase (non-canonical NTP hydrolase)